ncbi:MAG: molybdopterin-dependent oxidoreductase [Bryobacteraceae bacterium]|nr:molybdopterin-dependent oxidoreductase [Bryobacteraceae bacterium]MDW8376608.1 molybdopterin-dependent oxidoreductase [Bryobacterales bacterium]
MSNEADRDSALLQPNEPPEIQAEIPNRREFLASGALLGGTCLAALAPTVSSGQTTTAGNFEIRASDFIYTTCLQCNTGCEIKVRVQNGVAVKIDGNPYGPRSMDPHINWNTPAAQAAKINGMICPKGQSGIQSNYDPYRVVKVLKRAGKRGEGKWITIPFDRAIDEIVNGGVLFPQDGDSRVTGLRELYALRDPRVYSAMAADVAAIQARRMTVAEFKEKHRENLDKLIDPDHPDFGPKNNQFVFNWGRLKGGRSDFFLRFVRDSFGSVNAHGHTTVCQGSIYFAGKSMADQPVGGGWTGGAKAYWMADTAHAEFIIYWGANVLEGNYGPPLKVPKIMRGLASKRLKVAVIDPRYSKIAAKAWRWFPIKPGEDAAFALGMVRWIIENERYDHRYLENCNRAAAVADGEPTWSNGAWLVKIRPDGTGGAFLRASEIGLGGDADTFVCLSGGRPVAFKSDDATNPVHGDLFVDTTVNGIRVKSALQLLFEESAKKSIAEWAAIAGLAASDIITLAREFTSHGKRAVVEIHRGVSQHTNGFYNVLATMGALNLLIGNVDWKGGLVYGGGAYGETGGTGRPFQLGDHPAKITPFGIDIIRGGASYERSTIFSGYPAKRPWYPLASDVYQEVIPSAGDAYPYPIKVLFLYMGSPVYALPAGHSLIPTLMDTKKIPLFVCSDIVIGETTQYADYIFPDLTFLERWEFHRTHPSIVHRVSPVRQPVVASPNETVRVFNEEMPLSMEAVFLAIAERLQMPGFGPRGFGASGDLTRPEDFYLRMVANVAHGDSSTTADVCPDASEEEMQIFREARKHLPKTVFDEERWSAVVGPNWWKKVVYVLNRGGRWWSYEQGWTGEKVRAQFGRLVNLYQEKAATTRNSMTGEFLPGIATYLPQTDSLGRPLQHGDAPFTLITNRNMLACKTRTISNYWLLDVLPENFVEVSTVDARRLGLEDGDLVSLTSASNPAGRWDLGYGNFKPLIGRVRVTSRIRPGVVTFELGWGHWAYGASAQMIDGKLIPPDPRRATGIHANSAMTVDPYTRSPLSDVVGGSAVFYDTKVYLQKVGRASG